MQLASRVIMLSLLTSISFAARTDGLLKELKSIESVKLSKMLRNQRTQGIHYAIESAKACNSRTTYLRQTGGQILALLSTIPTYKTMCGNLISICESDAPKTYNVLEQHALSLGIQTPQLLIACKKGWFHSQIMGLLHELGFVIVNVEDFRYMTDEALEGQLIHEMALIKKHAGAKTIFASLSAWMLALKVGSMVSERKMLNLNVGNVIKNGTLNLYSTRDKAKNSAIWGAINAIAPHDLKFSIPLLNGKLLPTMATFYLARWPLGAISRYFEGRADAVGSYDRESAEKVLEFAKYCQEGDNFYVNEWDTVLDRANKADIPFANWLLYQIWGTACKTVQSYTLPIEGLASPHLCGAERVERVQKNS